MLAVQTLMRQAGGETILRPACPNCGRSMHVSRITPGTDGLPDAATFRCGECGVWLTEAAGNRRGRLTDWCPPSWCGSKE
jgi:transposase-like protein